MHIPLNLFSYTTVTNSSLCHLLYYQMFCTVQYIYVVVYSCFRGRPHIIDWKVSKKKKVTIQSLYDYPLQLAAYMGATNHAPNTQCLIHPEKVPTMLIKFNSGFPLNYHDAILR